MKCENCGNILVGATIICRVCNHNNAMQRVSDWRTKRVNSPRETRTRPISPATSSQRSNVGLEEEATLIRFPASSETTPKQSQPKLPTIDAEPELNEYPAWRAQLKEKVRQARQKRLAETPVVEVQPDEADLDPNPIVAAALKRIRRSSTSPSMTTTSRTVRYGTQATALAEEIGLDSEPQATPIVDEHRPPVKQPERRFTKPVERAFKPSPVSQPTPSQPARSKIETKTLTPRHATEVKLKPETKTQSTGAAKILPPLIKARPATESQKQEREQAKADPGPAIKPLPSEEAPRQSSGTQIIEIPYVLVSEMPDMYANSATLWVRTLAGACDFEIISLAYLPIFAAYATLNTSLGNEAFFILSILLAATTFVYQAVTLSISDRTFGMALLNVRLINTDDETLEITRRQKLLRAWAATIAFLCPPLNFIVMRLNRHGLSFPDLVSGTSPLEE
jgi:uncharacterized RDD family membrane protein YckC